LRDFIKIGALSYDNYGYAGNGSATNGVRIDVGLVDSGTLVVQANSTENLGVSNTSSVYNGNRIFVGAANPDSDIGIASYTNSNNATVVNPEGSSGNVTSGSRLRLEDLALGNGSLFIATKDENNVAEVDSGEFEAISGALVEVSNVTTDGPISIFTNSTGNSAKGSKAALSGGKIILERV